MPVGCYFFFLGGKPGMYEKVSETSAERRNHSEKKLRENLRDERVMVHPESLREINEEPKRLKKNLDLIHLEQLDLRKEENG